MWNRLKLVIFTVTPTAILYALWFFRDRAKRQKLKNVEDHCPESQGQQTLPTIEVTDADINLVSKIPAASTLPPVSDIAKNNFESEAEICCIDLKLQCDADNPGIKPTESAVLTSEVCNSQSCSPVGNVDKDTPSCPEALVTDLVVGVDALKNSRTGIADADRGSFLHNNTVAEDLDIDMGMCKESLSDSNIVQAKVSETLSAPIESDNSPSLLNCASLISDGTGIDLSEPTVDCVDPKKILMDNNVITQENINIESQLTSKQTVENDSGIAMESVETKDIQSCISVCDPLVEKTNVHNVDMNLTTQDEQLSLPVDKDEDLKNSCIYRFDFPSGLCGRLIGRHGHNIHQLKEASGANITIISKPYVADYQIIILEGTKDQVDKALKLIKAKFPEKKFPGVNYAQPELNIPPAQNLSAPVTPNISQLVLPAGVNSDVIVSRVVSANHIFVQQPTHPSFPHLERQMQMMMQCYDSEKETPGLPKPYEVGIVCVARIDNFWYRVQIVGTSLESDTCDVKMIDYGGYVQVQGSELKRIRRDFTMLPFQAIECYLYGIVSPSDEEDFPPEASSVLIELVSGAILQVQVVAVEEDQVPYVLLTKPIESRSLDINRELVNRGVARWYEL